VLPQMQRQVREMREELAKLMGQLVAVSVALERGGAVLTQVQEHVQTRLAPMEFTNDKRQRE
jgi:hypothetical protein